MQWQWLTDEWSVHVISCQMTFGPVRTLVTSHPDRQTEIDAPGAMHKSPLCIHTSGLNKIQRMKFQRIPAIIWSFSMVIEQGAIIIASH